MRCKICRHRIRGQHIEYKGRIYCPQDYAQIASNQCAGCQQPTNSSAIHALGSMWHRECLSCTVCRQPFPDKKFFVHENMPYCRHHYHEITGTLCLGCSEPIEGSWFNLGPCVSVAELSAKFHPDCWCCEHCQEPFNDIYYLWNGRTYCERDIKRLYDGKGKKPSKRNTYMPR